MFDEHAENSGKSMLGLVLLGPVLGMLYIFLLPLIALMTLLLALPEIAVAKKADIIDNSGMCMTCHSSKDFVKTFKNGEKLSVYVRLDEFKDSVHRFLKCADCHKQSATEPHLGKAFESKGAFIAETSRACRTCHTDEQLMSKQNHAFLTNKTNAPPCTECHGSHAIMHVAEFKSAQKANDYCLTCHQKDISKTQSNGEKLSLHIDVSKLRTSVHSKHACSDCHTEYTRTSHPVKQYASNREHSIAISEACRKCHDDKHTAVRESIHYKMISQGNLKAPVCTDCHGFHSVGPKAVFETLSGVPCRKCHEEVFQKYSKSVHGMAKANGKHKAPLCSSCHFAHEVKSAAVTEKIRMACLGCHENAETNHGKWLPNAGLHLSVVACATCHAPNSGKGVYLRLYDQNTNQPFTEDQIRKLMGGDYADLSRKIDAHGDGIDPDELWAIVRDLNNRGKEAKVTFLGKMNVSEGADAHDLAMKNTAVKECESCHHGNSAFLKNVTVAIVKADGKTAEYKAKPEVLGSMVSLLSLRQFYVLGSTRLQVLDIIGIAMVLGGMAVPIGHLTLRILTSPIREARRLNRLRKGGKR